MEMHATLTALISSSVTDPDIISDCKGRLWYLETCNSDWEIYTLNFTPSTTSIFGDKADRTAKFFKFISGHKVLVAVSHSLFLL